MMLETYDRPCRKTAGIIGRAIVPKLVFAGADARWILKRMMSGA